MMRAKPVRKAQPRVVLLQAVDPNDPITWNMDEAEMEIMEMSPQETDFLSSSDISMLLSTPMGTSPKSAEGMAVFQEISNEKPDDAEEAIARGMQLTTKGDYAEALVLFEMALTLPGTGTRRDRVKARELSEGEKISALYNCACCHSLMGDAKNGLIAFAGALEVGFDNFDTAMTDPDLASLREEPQFEGLILRFKPVKKGGIQGLFNKLF